MEEKNKRHIKENYIMKVYYQINSLEDTKKCLFIYTVNSSQFMRIILNDLYLLRKNLLK